MALIRTDKKTTCAVSGARRQGFAKDCVRVILRVRVKVKVKYRVKVENGFESFTKIEDGLTVEVTVGTRANIENRI